MSISSTSLVNTPTNSPSAYVPLEKKEKQKIELPQDPQEALCLVEDLYQKASAPTFEEKAKAPYSKTVDRYGDITLDPNENFEGPGYQINQNGQVFVKPETYELGGVLGIHEQATDPKVIAEVQQLLVEAKPQEEIPERSLEVGYERLPTGMVRIVKKNIDGNDQHYEIRPDGSVTVFQANELTHKMIYAQQIVKPGEFPVLKDGEERPVGKALMEASSSEGNASANGRIFNVEA